MSKPKMLYIMGEPGIGKSTVLRLAIADAHSEAQYSRPFFRTERTWVLGDIHDERAPTFKLTELGGQREEFSGTDALPMNVQPRVLEWLREQQPSHVIAEGDRLANGKFFDSVQQFYDLEVVLLWAPKGIAAERRVQRARRLGSDSQNASWVQGRITKTSNLFERYGEIVTSIDARQTIEQCAAILRAEPFFTDIRECEKFP